MAVTAQADELLDLAGRIMLTHGIAPEHLQQVIGGDLTAAKAIVQEGRTSTRLDDESTARLELYVNILLRLEWRLRGDGRAIRRALCTPLDALDGHAPVDLIGGSIAELGAIRRAVETIALPIERWFRVGH